MTHTTNGANPKKVAILVANHFEDREFNIPYRALQQAKAHITIVGSRMNDEYHGKRGEITIKPDATATELRAEDFDAIVIPGGGSPDILRTNDHMVRLIINAMAQSKVIAAICHGPQLLIEADQLRGRKATGYRAIRKDMQNAGAVYVDEPVVVEDNLITARRPGDLPIFTTRLLVRLGLTIEGVTFPHTTEASSDEWWPLATKWGGSTRQDILAALNTAIVGERYTLTALQQYIERVAEIELQVVLQEAIAIKEQNCQIVEQRLHQFGEQVTWQAVGSEAYAALQNWLQSSDDMSILRRALGDVQTGIIDVIHLSNRLTDPVTVDLLEQVHGRLAQLEERLGDLYRARAGASVKPPTPTTIAVS